MKYKLVMLSTDKPSRLIFDREENRLLPLQDEPVFMEYQDLVVNQHLYITSDEEIKEEWSGYAFKEDVKGKVFKHFYTTNEWYKDAKKIILTTDQYLIEDGVQPIDDVFLEWFVKNPSCREVEVNKEYNEERIVDGKDIGDYSYKIVIPKEEPKQETLEEAAYQDCKKSGFNNTSYAGHCTQSFIQGAKWQAERMYSEAIEFAEWIRNNPYVWNYPDKLNNRRTTEELFKQFKKK